MGRHIEVVLEDWPQPCNGGCGRLLRPPRAKAHEYPTVVTFASVRVLDPWCQLCSKARQTPEDIALDEVRLQRLRQELEYMVADRRRRGVAPEGLVLPGDEKARGRLRERKPKARKPEFGDTEAPLGRCQRGHAFDRYDLAGRRVCDTCTEIRMADRKRRHLENGAPDSEFGHCRRGHPYTYVNGVRKYCPTCKAMSRERNMMRAE